EGSPPFTAGYRIVNGDYVWAMGQALMIGYARHGRTSRSISFLQWMSRNAGRASKSRNYHVLSICHRASLATHLRALHVSKHRRGFPWPDGRPGQKPQVAFSEHSGAENSYRDQLDSPAGFT